MTGRIRCATLAAGMALLLAGGPAAAAPPELFQSAAPADRGLRAARPRVEIRHRAAAPVSDVLRAAREGRLRTVRLNLFDDAIIDASIDRVIDRGVQSYTLVGATPGEESGSFALSVQDGAVVGNVRQGDSAYQVRMGPDGQEVRQVDLRLYPPCGTGACNECQAVRPPETAQALDVGEPPAAGDDGTMFDVMVVYTPAARTAAGGTSAMAALINLAIDESNQAYMNSLITPRMRLVYQQEVTYTEIDFSTDLSRLQGSADGFVDNVHTLRNQCGADLVSMVVNNSDACGVGYLMTTLSAGFESRAFSVVHWDCATGYYSFAHELGHNMGCHHAVGDAGLTRQDPILYPYCYGWRFNNNASRTIMAYAPGTRRQYFSNPNVSYGGFPTGVPTNSSDQAYNALCINNVANTVANWRSAARITTQPRSTNTVGGSTVTFTVAAAGTGPLSYRWKKDGGELSDGGTLSGSQTASLRITGVQESDEGGYACRVTNLFSSAESTVASLTVGDVTLTVISAYGMAWPPAGAYSYRYGSNVTCSVTSSPAVSQDAQNYKIAACTGWTGSGSVPAGGAGTNVSFAITANSVLTWRWQVLNWTVSNQTFSGTTNYQAHDAVTAQDGYQIVAPGSVTMQAGKTVRLAPGFAAASGSYLRATINTNL